MTSDSDVSSRPKVISSSSVNGRSNGGYGQGSVPGSALSVRPVAGVCRAPPAEETPGAGRALRIALGVSELGARPHLEEPRYAEQERCHLRHRQELRRRTRAGDIGNVISVRRSPPSAPARQCVPARTPRPKVPIATV